MLYVVLRENPISLSSFHLCFCSPFWTPLLFRSANKQDWKQVNSDFRLEIEENNYVQVHLALVCMIFLFCTSLWSFEIALLIFLNVLMNFEHIPTSLSSLNLFKQNTTHFWTKFELIETCPKPSKRKITEGFTGHRLNLREYFVFGPIANKRCQITPQSRKFE